MQLGTAREQRLGPHDVGSAGERAVRVARSVARQLGVDAIGDALLRRGGKSPWRPDGGDPMAAEMSDPGAGQDADDRGIGPGQRAHEAQLTARRRQ